MRLLLLNINYLQHQNILKTMQINITDFEHPTHLVWWRTLTRHVKWNKFPSHTWLPYLTPNGVTHYNNT